MFPHRNCAAGAFRALKVCSKFTAAMPIAMREAYVNSQNEVRKPKREFQFSDPTPAIYTSKTEIPFQFFELRSENQHSVSA